MITLNTFLDAFNPFNSKLNIPKFSRPFKRLKLYELRHPGYNDCDSYTLMIVAAYSSIDAKNLSIEENSDIDEGNVYSSGWVLNPDQIQSIELGVAAPNIQRCIICQMTNPNHQYKWRYEYTNGTLVY